MPPPSRDQALAELEEGHARLAGLLERLSDDDLTRPATIGDGDWSAKDLVGHVESWEEIALRALADWRQGKTPETQQPGYWTHQTVDRVNAENVQRKRGLGLSEVRSRSDRTHQAVMEAIQGMDDTEWTSPAPYPVDEPTTLADVLGGILSAPDRPFGHAFAHLPDLEAYVHSRSTG
jgi:hypothetical protein